MPDLLDAPPKSALPDCLKPFVFNSATAAQAARKRHEADRIRQEEIDRLAQPQKPAVTDERLVLLAEQITLTRSSLNVGKLEPKDRAQLVRALCGLLDQQRIAKGEPLPGSRRPREDRARVSAGWIELQPALPSAPGPQVAPAPTTPTTPEVACIDCQVITPARPLGWEYDDPTPAVLDPEKLPGDVTP